MCGLITAEALELLLAELGDAGGESRFGGWGRVGFRGGIRGGVDWQTGFVGPAQERGLSWTSNQMLKGLVWSTEFESSSWGLRMPTHKTWAS